MTRGRKTLTDVFTVARDPNLSEGEKVLWTIYRSYDSGRGAWPSDGTLAEHMDKGLRSVRSYRAKLLERGYLQQTLRGPRPALYRAVVPDGPAEPQRTKRTPAYADIWDTVRSGITDMEKLLRRAAAISQHEYDDPTFWTAYFDARQCIEVALADEFPDLYERAGYVFECLDNPAALVELLDRPKELRAEISKQLKGAIELTAAAANGRHA